MPNETAESPNERIALEMDYLNRLADLRRWYEDERANLRYKKPELFPEDAPQLTDKPPKP